VNLVHTLDVFRGELLLTSRGIYFHPIKPAKEEPKFGMENRRHLYRDRRWLLERIVEIHGRRYLLRKTALEIYFADMQSVFISFLTVRDRQWFYGLLKQQQTPLLTVGTLNPSEIFKKSNLTERWRSREISNFEYLMQLNISAGRSYNDTSQYPVFPWILTNYSSKTLDLNDPKNYRDLRKPVGALDETRLQVHFLTHTHTHWSYVYGMRMLSTYAAIFGKIPHL